MKLYDGHATKRHIENSTCMKILSKTLPNFAITDIKQCSLPSREQTIKFLTVCLKRNKEQTGTVQENGAISLPEASGKDTQQVKAARNHLFIPQTAEILLHADWKILR